MERKIIGIFICIMFILFPSLSASEIINDDKSIKEISYDHSDLIHPIISESPISNFWLQQDKLVASDGTAWDWFGYSVSIDRNYAIIGAYHDNDFLGSAYIFKRDGRNWTQQAKLTASDGANKDCFGYSVSIHGDYALIGSFEDDDSGFNSGSAYVFKRNGTKWKQQAKLIASDGATNDWFGFSVSMVGEYAVIGAFKDDDNGESSGSAYVFKRDGNTWSEKTKLLASDGVIEDLFGYSVSINGDYAIVGAYSAVNGSAYIFKRNSSSWAEEAKLTVSDPSCFGCSVSIQGDYAIIGDYYGYDNRGAAYIFKRNGTNWTQQAKLIASDGATWDDFGGSVSIDGNYAIIGASFDDSGTGSTYIFKRNGTTWIEEQKLIASDGAKCDFFGTSVSLSGEYAIIGAHFDNDNGEESGSAYIFKKNQLPDSPIITGPSSGKVGKEYVYNFSLSDPDNDSIYLRVDWGNGTPSPWQGPYDSGTTVRFNHTWNQRGTFTIRAQAKDNYGSVSKWGTLEITIPRNKATFYSFFLQFLERFPLLMKFLHLKK